LGRFFHSISSAPAANDKMKRNAATASSLASSGSAASGRILTLGIDPGLNSTGLGLIVTSSDGVSHLEDSDTVHTRASDPLAARLIRIYEHVAQAVGRWHPQAVSVEAIFFAKNVRSAVMLAHARAAAIVAASSAGAEVFEYSPLEIKQAVAGYGRAGKDQVQKMVRVLLNLEELPGNEHVADALAAALCHIHRGARAIRIAAVSRAESGGENPSKALLALARRGRHRRSRYR